MKSKALLKSNCLYGRQNKGFWKSFCKYVLFCAKTMNNDSSTHFFYAFKFWWVSILSKKSFEDNRHQKWNELENETWLIKILNCVFLMGVSRSNFTRSQVFFGTRVVGSGRESCWPLGNSGGLERARVRVRGPKRAGATLWGKCRDNWPR
jgi:hypothetical protein